MADLIARLNLQLISFPLGIFKKNQAFEFIFLILCKRLQWGFLTQNLLFCL